MSSPLKAHKRIWHRFNCIISQHRYAQTLKQTEDTLVSDFSSALPITKYALSYHPLSLLSRGNADLVT
jgi:hypothetical protein